MLTNKTPPLQDILWLLDVLKWLCQRQSDHRLFFLKRPFSFPVIYIVRDILKFYNSKFSFSKSIIYYGGYLKLHLYSQNVTSLALKNQDMDMRHKTALDILCDLMNVFFKTLITLSSIFLSCIIKYNVPIF